MSRRKQCLDGEAPVTEVLLRDRYRDPSSRRQLLAEFAGTGLVVLESFLTEQAFSFLRAEVDRLRPFRKHRRFEMKKFRSHRQLSVLGGRTVRDEAPGVARLYETAELTDFVKNVVSSPLFPCEADYEWCVVNFFEGLGDTQGWHTDDTAFVLIMMLEETVSECRQGGALEWVPVGETDADSGEAPARGAVRRLYMKARDACLMRGDRVLHRISPIDHDDGCRVTILLSWQHRMHVPRDGSGIELYA